MIDETGRNIPVEVSDLSVSEVHFDQQSHTHHKCKVIIIFQVDQGFVRLIRKVSRRDLKTYQKIMETGKKTNLIVPLIQNPKKNTEVNVNSRRGCMEFSVAGTFHKTLENTSKILHAFQHDYINEDCTKF